MSDFRAFLKPRPDAKSIERVIGKDVFANLMRPLHATGGLLFPYTPSIMQVGATANYDEYAMTHTNYTQPVYKNSQFRDIVLAAKFTAQTASEARYVLAMLKMLSNVTKMNFGERDSIDFGGTGTAGLPPPVLLFSYLGAHMFNEVPVVVSSYSMDLPDDVDYVRVYIGNNTPEDDYNPEEATYVPAELTINLELKPYYNPQFIRKEFKLSDFASGALIRGNNNGAGSPPPKGFL